MRRPSRFSEDPEERRLARLFSNYTSPAHHSFRPDFRAWVDENCASAVNPELKKKGIVTFIEINGRRPSKALGDLEERKLGECMNRITSPSSPTYDHPFKLLLDTLCPLRGVVKKETPPKRDSINTNKQQIIEFVNKHSVRPKKTSDDPVERKLGGLMGSYTCPSQSCYDPEFKVTLDALCPLTKELRRKHEKT